MRLEAREPFTPISSSRAWGGTMTEAGQASWAHDPAAAQDPMLRALCLA